MQGIRNRCGVNTVKNMKYSELEILNQLPGFITVHDFNSSLIYTNDSAAKLLGFKSRHDSIGCHFSNMPCKASEIASVFASQDQKVLRSRKPLKVIGYSCYVDGTWRAVIGEKKLMHDSESNPIAIICHFNDFTKTGVINISAYLIQHYYFFQTDKQKQFFYEIVNSDNNTLKFTPRELECVFYFTHGFTGSYIASRMKLSKRTVEYYLDNIKQKVGCINKNDALEKLVYLGYLNILPEKMLNFGL